MRSLVVSVIIIALMAAPVSLKVGDPRLADDTSSQLGMDKVYLQKMQTLLAREGGSYDDPCTQLYTYDVHVWLSNSGQDDAKGYIFVYASDKPGSKAAIIDWAKLYVRVPAYSEKQVNLRLIAVETMGDRPAISVEIPPTSAQAQKFLSKEITLFEWFLIAAGLA